jgi:uncharacterized membrane protein
LRSLHSRIWLVLPSATAAQRRQAPLILLAQTRQADRDKAIEISTAKHRDELATSQTNLLEENTRLTEQVAKLAREIDDLTHKIHDRVGAT